MSQTVQQILVAGMVVAALVYLALRHIRSRRKPGCPDCAVFKATVGSRRSGR
jgi:hypothetical protein